MWQVYNKKQDPSTQAKCNSPCSTEILSRKYGKIFLSTHQELQFQQISNKQSQVLITTHPFYQQISWNQKIPRTRTIFVQSNQQNKNLQAVDRICKELIERGVNRQSTVYIQGGGMLLDLASFACSIYMRGIKNVIFIPTTLLAVVDATVGGKNGVNWEGTKNMLGTIRQPNQIRISMHYLNSLSDREFSNGLAQVIKMAITHDKDLFQLLEDSTVNLKKLRQDSKLLRQVIKKSLQIKVKVVQKDQFEKNQRKWLNFGHTVGHAIQLSKAGQGLMHGECVAIGILNQIKIGENMNQIFDRNIYNRVQRVFKKFNLPTKTPEKVSVDQLISLMAKDKKNIQSKSVQMSLVNQIGDRKLQMTAVPIAKLYQHFSKWVFIDVSKQYKNVNKFKQQVQQVNKRWLQQNRFPSSKSLSIRYLFLAALQFLKTKGSKNFKIQNFLESDDTICIKQCLRSLGFNIIEDNLNRNIQIVSYKRKTQGVLNVENSGLTARFIVPLCAHLEGQWIIECHPRMSERPNQQIFNFCYSHYDCKFQWVKKQNSFPVKIISKGMKQLNKPIELSSQQSSQFLSSVLLNSLVWKKNNKPIQIRLATKRLVSQSYIRMTINCLQKLGTNIHSKYRQDRQYYQFSITDNKEQRQTEQIYIQQDLSSYSYPFALSLIHEAKVQPMADKYCQGDVKFYQYCQELFYHRKSQKSVQTYQQMLQLQFSECTDTFMTFAAILATNINNRFGIKYKRIRIKGIGNQRVKQSNRIQMVKRNLNKIGYSVQQTQDGLILPVLGLKYKEFELNQSIIFQTEGDHRLAMSMALLASFMMYRNQVKQKKVKIIVDDKNAVNKTFPIFWQYMREAGASLNYSSQKQKQKQSQMQKQNKRRYQFPTSSKINKILLFGNRGSGKTSIASQISSKTENTHMIDLDEQISKQIREITKDCKDIKQYVQKQGWQQFRKLENQILQKYVYSSYLQNSIVKYGSRKNFVISAGGGIVDWVGSVKLLRGSQLRNESESSIFKIYIQKQYKDLRIEINENRPFIPNFEQVFQRRSKIYEQLADQIITIPHTQSREKETDFKNINQYVVHEFNRIFNKNTDEKRLKEGFIYCTPRIYVNEEQINIKGQIAKPISFSSEEQFRNYLLKQHIEPGQNISGVQLRIDSICQQLIQLYPSKYTRNSSVEQMDKMEELLQKHCRHEIAQFKLANKKLINRLDLSIILTLRTKQELGLYPFQFDSLNKSELIVSKYEKWLKMLEKIPSNYLDYEWVQYLNRTNQYTAAPPSNNLSNANYIWSYHGSDIQIISSLLNKPKTVNDLKKICFKGDEQIWNSRWGGWKQKSDICINLNNPLSRVHESNRFKMIIRQNDRSSVIKIPNRKQLGMLKMLKKFFK